MILESTLKEKVLFKEVINDNLKVYKKSEFTINRGPSTYTYTEKAADSSSNKTTKWTLNDSIQNDYIDNVLFARSTVVFALRYSGNTHQTGETGPYKKLPFSGNDNMYITAFPYTAMIDNTKFLINSKDVSSNIINYSPVKQYLYKHKDRINKPYPTKADTYRYNSDMALSDTLNQFKGFDNASTLLDVPMNGNLEIVLSGSPHSITAYTAAATGTIYAHVEITEDLPLSIFNGEFKQAIYGISSLNLTINWKSNMTEVLKINTDWADGTADTFKLDSVELSDVRNFNVLYGTYTAPSTLPIPKYIVNSYYETTAANEAVGYSIPADGSYKYNMKAENLTEVPRYVILYVKNDDEIADPNVTNAFYPITNVKLQYGNLSQLQSFPKEKLYSMAVENGLQMSYAQWRGFGIDGSDTDLKPFKNALTGGFIILEFGKDIALPEDLAPGCKTSVSFRPEITIHNPTDELAVGNKLFAYMVFLNDRYFITDTTAAQSTNVATFVLPEDVIDTHNANNDIMQPQVIEGMGYTAGNASATVKSEHSNVKNSKDSILNAIASKRTKELK